MSKTHDGFVVGRPIQTHTRDEVAEDGTLIINEVRIELTVVYPKGLDLKTYKPEIEKAIVGLMPSAYMELERRSQL